MFVLVVVCVYVCVWLPLYNMRVACVHVCVLVLVSNFLHTLRLTATSFL